jgi:hypothetical protein
VGICLARVCGSATTTTTTTCAKALLTYISVTVSAPNVLVADVFGIVIFLGHFVPYNRYYFAPPFPFVFYRFITQQVSKQGNKLYMNVCTNVRSNKRVLSEPHPQFQHKKKACKATALVYHDDNNWYQKWTLKRLELNK